MTQHRCRVIAALVACLPLGGCFGIGPERLSRDEIDFSRALAISDNQQTLLNIVRLRYAEAPTFLDLTQVISGYQAQQTLSGSLDLFPSSHASTSVGGGGSMQLQENPTFTYAPVTGEQFSETFLRPLPPGTVLPLVLTGIPIDLLFALVVQSINGMDNAQVLAGSVGAMSEDFARLLHDLRVLQVAGRLDVRLGQAAIGQGRSDRRAAADVVKLAILNSDDARMTAVAAEARRLLGLPDDETPFDIVFDRRPVRPHEVAILTRSVLGVLGSMAFAIDVPPGDVADGRTMPTMPAASPVAIHSGRSAPDDAFVAIEYDRHWYWISSRDFRSKLAFAVLQNLLALAQSKQPPGAVVTIPAG
ncbi:hypothetical protein [Lichenicola sp.]|uniref:hypothetical protein n=1 Tax=Lichenicola sp. TaxID=2804529 RepID=UPI003B008D59